MSDRKPALDLPSVERLRELLNYDPETGIFTWTAKRSGRGGSAAGTINKHGYVVIGIDGKDCYAHRVAWALVYGEYPSLCIDHKNTNRSDNRMLNLRLATISQNSANMKRPPSNTSGKKGVTWHAQRGKWKAQIKVGGKRKHLGLFDNVEDAHAAYVAAANDNFGEYARAE